MKTILILTTLLGLSISTLSEASVFPVLKCHMTEEYMDYGISVIIEEKLSLPRFPAVESTQSLIARVTETTIYGKANVGDFKIAEKEASNYEGKSFDLKVLSNETPNQNGEYRAHLTVTDSQKQTFSEDMLCSFYAHILE